MVLEVHQDLPYAQQEIVSLIRQHAMIDGTAPRAGHRYVGLPLGIGRVARGQLLGQMQRLAELRQRPGPSPRDSSRSPRLIREEFAR